mmetsp:Transcript_31671/g.77236  ORF Transcript_31671/g.77236 Transcript_31671/m.77236 type:complete len:236 (+) Transcript_31671:51-758(+)
MPSSCLPLAHSFPPLPGERGPFLLPLRVCCLLTWSSIKSSSSSLSSSISRPATRLPSSSDSFWRWRYFGRATVATNAATLCAVCSGRSETNFMNVAYDITATSISVCACTVAVLTAAKLPIRPISPISCPLATTAMCLPAIKTLAIPLRMTYRLSLISPSEHRVSPGLSFSRVARFDSCLISTIVKSPKIPTLRHMNSMKLISTDLARLPYCDQFSLPIRSLCPRKDFSMASCLW